MSSGPGLPRLASWLLRLSPVAGEVRAEVYADLLELFVLRRRDRGTLHAHWRLYHDVASLWLQPRSVPRPAIARPGLTLVRDMQVDLTYAVRLFARQPAILVLTILGLALGLGIATAAFSMMNAAVLRGEGVVDPGRAPGILRLSDRSVATAWSYDEFLRLREGATRMQVEAVLDDAAAVRTTATDSETTPATVAFVSGGFFGATGGRAMAGRTIAPADERDTGPPSVVISFAFWTAKLNRDPGVVGRTIWIGRTAGTIVGVAERRFTVPSSRMLWMPLTAYEAVYHVAPTRTPHVLVDVFGRLLPNATFAEAEAQLSGVAASLSDRAPSREPALRVKLDPHAGLGRMSESGALSMTVLVFALIGLVLLLACANVATVLISSAIAREREIGVRAALGASQSRIVRQLVTESLALGTLASTIGLLFAHWTVPMIAAMLEAPAGADFAPDLNVYLFVAAMTVVSGIGAGLAPAWHSRAADLLTPLKGDGARDNRISPRRLRSGLVMTQAAVSILLIVLATLFVRASVRGASIDVGFHADGLYAISVGLGDTGRDGTGLRSFLARAIPEIQALPGIASVSLAEIPPFGDVSKTAITRETPPRVVQLNRTTGEYFGTLGVRLLDGRTYTAGEIAAKAPVAVVSQSLARAYWHEQSPVGQLLPVEIPLPPTTIPGGKTVVPSPRPTVIGVVGDAIPARLYERNTFALYEPLDPGSEIFARLVIRVTPGTTGVMQQATQRLRAIDPQATISVTSVDARLRQEAARPRMLATLTGIVGAIATILCGIGLYGLTASVVSQRTREVGIRVALGAQAHDVLRLLMWDSLRPVVLGVVVGVGAALLASRVVLAVMFFGVSPHDPMAFLAAAAILVTAATLAVLVPTRRASTVDAAGVLRQS